MPIIALRLYNSVYCIFYTSTFSHLQLYVSYFENLVKLKKVDKPVSMFHYLVVAEAKMVAVN